MRLPAAKSALNKTLFPLLPPSHRERFSITFFSSWEKGGKRDGNAMRARKLSARHPFRHRRWERPPLSAPPRRLIHDTSTHICLSTHAIRAVISSYTRHMIKYCLFFHATSKKKKKKMPRLRILLYLLGNVVLPFFGPFGSWFQNPPTSHLLQSYAPAEKKKRRIHCSVPTLTGRVT